jgi:hypothetical protein
MPRYLTPSATRLALLDISKSLEPPALAINHAPMYARFLDDLCALLASAANHLGAERLDQIRQAILAAYKLGYLHGEVVDLTTPEGRDLPDDTEVVDLTAQARPPDDPRPAA